MAGRISTTSGTASLFWAHGSLRLCVLSAAGVRTPRPVRRSARSRRMDEARALSSVGACGYRHNAIQHRQCFLTKAQSTKHAAPLRWTRGSRCLPLTQAISRLLNGIRNACRGRRSTRSCLHRILSLCLVRANSESKPRPTRSNHPIPQLGNHVIVSVILCVLGASVREKEPAHLAQLLEGDVRAGITILSISLPAQSSPDAWLLAKLVGGFGARTQFGCGEASTGVTVPFGALL